MVTVNVVVLAGTVAADPVQRRMPSGDEVTELFSGCHDETPPRWLVCPSL
jgi:single-stranded DNA-binding protein